MNRLSVKIFKYGIKTFLMFCLLVTSNLLWAKKNTSVLPSIINGTINLHGDTLYLQKGTTIRFQGGKICNGTVVFNENRIIEPNFEDTRFMGIVADSYFNIRDYGAEPSTNKDCSDIFNDIIKLRIVPDGNNNNPKHIYVPKGLYYIDKTIELFAGWNSPVTLSGEGRHSIICQRKDNQIIIKFFEQNHIKDLTLTYKNNQNNKQTNSIAIACQRAIFSNFDNLIITKAFSAFGYISVDKQKKEYNPTGYKEQCYVSCNFRNIRIYETSGYAFDLKKEFPQGDSGSVYDNIYINCNNISGGSQYNTSIGAIRFENTVACFTQLNIEGNNYSSSLINLDGMSRVSINSIHLEGIKHLPSIADVKVQSVLSCDIIDVQFCDFSNTRYYAFNIKDSGFLCVNMLLLREDCNRLIKRNSAKLSNNANNLKIVHLFDPINVF